MITAAAVVSAIALSGLAVGAEASEALTPEAMTQQRIDAANDAYNEVGTRLEFITMSDTELGGAATADKTSEQVAYENSRAGFERIRTWADKNGFSVEAVVDNGDVVGANEPEYNDHLAGRSEKTAGWYRAVERVMTENFPDAQKMFTQGNHDIADLMGKTFDEKHAGDPDWSYPKAADEYVGNFHRKVNGYDFIGLDYNGKSTFGYSGQRTGYQEFLRSTLAGISAAPDYDPAKPIFVNIHSGYAGTSLGGPFHGDYDLAGPDLQTILAAYPQAMLGSAHTHFSSNPATSIYQRDFTVYENASMNYIYQDVPGDFLGGGYFEGNQGDPANGWNQKAANFISVLDDGRTIIRRFDVTRQRWMGMPWVVDTAKGRTGFAYEDADRSTTAPWWDAAAVSTDKVTETSLTLGFDQAVDDELVNFYQVEITDRVGDPVAFTANQVPDFGKNKPKSFTGSFKAYSRFFMTPNTMSFDIAGLKPAKTYNVRVYAFDDFQNRSTALEGSFRTAGTLTFPGFPDRTTPIPGDEFLDMQFEGDLADEAGRAVPATATGAVSFVDDDRPGAAGKAVRIGADPGSYVSLGRRSEFDLGTDKDLTVNFWTKLTAVGGYGSIISNKNWSNYYRSGVNLAPEGADTGKLELTLGDDSKGVYVTGDVPNYRGSWHMMSFTIDRTADTARTYFDGALVKESDIASVGSLTSGLEMLIGVDGSRSYPTGLDMDDLKMWASPLSPDEIASLFAASDTSRPRESLSGAVEYANELLASSAVEAENGRVFDSGLSKTLRAAIATGDETLATADATRAEIRTAYDGLKSAVAAFESQPRRYTYAVTAENGTVTPAEGVVDAQGDLSLRLKPSKGYKSQNARVTLSGAGSFTLKGNRLVIHGVEQRVLMSVGFASKGGDR
ncbi:LamG domain-containing protein [Microbacterium sp. NPDC057659]|uniref:LamG domain-containing protein n=1 Tax=Microbacterium sp. NPDC057659 TaxID=3346198 RepID=UPI00366DE565